MLHIIYSFSYLPDFSNICKGALLQELAESDVHELVQQVQEYFVDYYAVNTDVFSLNLEGLYSAYQDNFRSYCGMTNLHM